MPSTKPHPGKSKIPVGRLVSVSGNAPKPPPRIVTPKPLPNPARRPWGRHKLAAAGGIGFLLVVATLGMCIGQPRKSTPSDSIVAAASNDIVPIAAKQNIAASQLPATPPKSTGRQAKKSPELNQASEVKVVVATPSKPEILTVEPRLVIVPIKDPLPSIDIEPETRPVVASIEETPFEGVALGRVNAPRCEKFGTAVEFQKSPIAAYELAEKDKNKLVMVLHIAGNFEDKGFT